MSAFDCLPLECLEAIFRLLDPVGLIAASQTCERFRRIISPSRKHFAERLLALELDERHGGITPTYVKKQHCLMPPYEDQAWKDVRLACPGCLRLLHHTAFEEEVLLKFKFQKPQAGSLVATECLNVTSWEPLKHCARSRRAEQLKMAVVERDRATRKKRYRLYDFAVSRGNHSFLRPGETYDDLLSEIKSIVIDESTRKEAEGVPLLDWQESQTLDLFDEYCRIIDDGKIGLGRMFRRCIECQFRERRGAFPPHADDYRHHWLWYRGGAVVQSRQYRFESMLDLVLPNLTNYMSAVRPDYQWRKNPANTYMVRCPSCKTWQELCNFRSKALALSPLGRVLHGHRKSVEEARECSDNPELMRCHRCRVADCGARVLAEELLALAQAQVDDWQERCLRIIHSRSIDLAQTETLNLPDTYRIELRRLNAKHDELASRWKQHKHNNFTIIDLDAEDLEENIGRMRSFREEWLQAINGIPGYATYLPEGSDRMQSRWRTDLDEIVAFWRWLRIIKQELKDDPNVLIAWALDQPRLQLSGTV